MPFELATSGDELEEYLTPLLPPEWRVQESTQPLGKTTGIVLTYTQGDISTGIDGTTLGPGQVGIDFALILSAPETDPGKGLARLNMAAPHLLTALDSHPNLLWTKAERSVLQSGETIYLIPIQVIATYSIT